jgi:hypothetical protein
VIRVQRLGMCSAVAVAAALLASSGLASTRSAVSVRPDQSSVSTKLGHKFAFRTTIANRDASPAGLIAHLNVVSLSSRVYVDPEDWSAHRTRYLPSIPRGRSLTIPWKLEAVNSGEFAIYVTVLPRNGGTLLAAGSPVRVTVAERRTLNSGGILPLAIGIPAVLALIWGGVRLRRRLV